jgi:plastocyanin
MTTTPLSRSRLLATTLVLAAALAVMLAAAAERASAAGLPGARISAAQTIPAATYPGMQRLHFEYGPLDIVPGQNTIEVALNQLKPQVPGYITRFKPDLVYAKDHTVPRVDVIHLHHGVWLNNLYPTFAAGEEKTIVNFPQGYGYHFAPSDSWLMNYMIHNLTTSPSKVFITYDIDFVPDSTPAAASITPVHPLWMDVAGITAYPVFDAVKGSGRHGRFTFPDQARGRQKKAIGGAHRWRVPKDITLVGAAGHLHPGGLWNDLTATRGTRSKRLFRSEAKYFEPAGAVSWDVAMTATKPDWRVALKAGDVVKVSTTYDTRRASWYESMGIDVVFYADGVQPGAVDPFAGRVDTRGWVTHGHLRENDNHGGQRLGLPDARRLLPGANVDTVAIRDYVYGRGDLTLAGRAGRPPVVRAGQSLSFLNLDATKAMTPRQSAYHTITACKAPCSRSTGIAYPLADGDVQFDSGELGYGPYVAGMKFTPAANRNTWKTPKSLRPGTYTYFCRIHPFMRGAFRVVSDKARR